MKNKHLKQEKKKRKQEKKEEASIDSYLDMYIPSPNSLPPLMLMPTKSFWRASLRTTFRSVTSVASDPGCLTAVASTEGATINFRAVTSYLQDRS